MLKNILSAATLLFLVACSTGPQAPTAPPLAQYGAPLQLTVANIEMRQEYQPRMTAPSVDHLMSPSPTEALNDWAKARLVARGTAGFVAFTIKDASIISRILPRDTGLRSAFTRQQAEELVANVEVEISANNRDTGFSGFTTVRVSRLLTIPEGLTQDQRSAYDRVLIGQIMTEFNREAEAGIRQHLAPVLNR